MQSHLHKSHFIISGAIIIAALIIAYALSATAKPIVHEAIEPTFLYVQTAAAGSLVQGEDTWTLTLNDVSPDTVYFSDRPARETGLDSTEAFVADWVVGEDSFAVIPPNAALDFVDSSGEQEVVVLELLTADYDPNVGTLIYEVILLDSELSEDVSFATAALFIDSTYKTYNCKCEPEEGKDSCKCSWDYSLGKSTTKEFRVSCKGSGSNVDLGVSQRQPNTTCTIATSYGLGYRTKSCTNWSTSKKDEVKVNAECSY